MKKESSEDIYRFWDCIYILFFGVDGVVGGFGFDLLVDCLSC